MSVSFVSRPAMRTPRRRHDWSDDLSLALAGFSTVAGTLLLVAPGALRQRVGPLHLADPLLDAVASAGIVVAVLLAWPRTRSIGVTVGAGGSAALSLGLLLDARLELVPVTVAILCIFVGIAVRIDRLRQDADPVRRA